MRPPARYPRGPLLAIAESLAAHAAVLVEGVSVAVVYETAGDFEIVAQAGGVDVAQSFDRRVARTVARTDVAYERAGVLVAPFSAVFGHALLIVVGDPSAPLGGEAREALHGLLAAGGIALDRVFAASAAARWDLPSEVTSRRWP